jgi:signal transduction histidine kinase
MNPDRADLHGLDRAAWAQQYRDPARAAEMGREWAGSAGDNPALAARGEFHLAWAELRWGSEAAARAAQRRLEALAGLLREAAIDALVRDLRAAFLRREQRFEEALALLEGNLALPQASRLPQAHCTSATGAAIACGALHRMDDALRHFHRAVAHAQASGDAALIANAAGNVGAAHYDVYDLDDALRHCRESHEQAARAGAHGARVTACVNLIAILCDLNHHAEARPYADELQHAAQGVRADKRGKYATFCAEVARGCGEPDRAQALLDEAAALRAPGEAASLEWAGVQARLWLARGDALRARELAEARLAAHVPANVNDLPLTVLRLRECAAHACEALGDLRAALDHQRALHAYREQLLGRSARARRVTLEIEHGLALARQQRDAAQAEQQRLAQLNDALQAANRAKSDFLAAASHDLRQPVHALALQVAALRGEIDSPRRRDRLERIDACVGALSSLFDGLLDLSRIDAGMVQPKWQPVALPLLLDALVHTHRSEAERKGLWLSLRVAALAQHAIAHSDPLLLERVLRNLIVNALRYTHAGGVLVTLRWRGSAWRIDVRDSGPGIDPALHERVFDEFFQADSAAARGRDEGLGLGLAIVRRLARLLEAGIELRSAPGRGTRFAVTLARSVVASPPTQAPAAAPAVNRLPAALRTIVIEDDAEVRTALSDLLAQWGCDVAAARCCDELDLPEGWRADAALLDVRLHDGRDGIDEARRLRSEHHAALPCLLVTGESAPEALRRLHASGLPWLHKPVSVEALHRWLAAQQPRHA